MTDSQITLAWIKSVPSRWTIFVSNRVSEIQQLTSNCIWRHISSPNNLADLISRGCTSVDLINSSLWWHGPAFLSSPNFNLNSVGHEVTLTEIPEERKGKVIQHNWAKTEFWDLMFTKFSSFLKRKRVLPY